MQKTVMCQADGISKREKKFPDQKLTGRKKKVFFPSLKKNKNVITVFSPSFPHSICQPQAYY